MARSVSLASTVRGTAATLTLVACVTACGDNGGPPSPAATGPAPFATQAPPAATGDIPPNPVARDLTLPLDAYMLSDDQSKEVFRATEILKQKCMRDKGFRYTPEKPIPPAGPIGNELRYGSADADIAARYGYGFPPDRDPDVQKKPVSDNDRLPAKAIEALTGLKPGERPSPSELAKSDRGCVGAAERALAKGAPDVGDGMTAQLISQESFLRSMQDRRVRKVFAAWSLCMEKKGFAYKSPMDPAKDFVTPGPASPKERSTATSDVACKRESNVVGVWYSVEGAYQKGSIRANSHQLEKLRTYNETVVKAASSVR